MGDSFKNEVKSSSINFNNKSLISNNSGWKISSGSGTISSVITLNEHSSCTINLNKPIQSNQVRYLKILTDVTCDDDTISTDSEHYLSVCYTINYNKDEPKDIVEIFYPKFDFENLIQSNIVSNFSIVDLNDEIINNISITIYNEYDIPIKIKQTALYYSLSPVDGNQLNDEFDRFNDYLGSDEYLDNLFNDYANGLSTGKYNLVIPLVDTLPDINSVPDGYICRVKNIT